MPAIRDFSQAQTVLATGLTIVLPIPNFVQGDLLLAIISSDTGTTETWSATGWTVLFNVFNACQLTVLHKTAGATETDATFTRSVAESFNGVLLSIQDVNAATPVVGISGTGFLVANTALARSAMPQLTTVENNNLLIYAQSNSGLAIPSIIEGPVTGIVGQDGVAESLGVGWGFKGVSGLTSPAVFVSNVLAAASINVIIKITPPTTGATVIPAYCAADASVYVDPINGLSAYNGNGAFAATATTSFGTTINGRTLANGTVAGLSDYGINSFHSVGQMTGTVTANTWAGAVQSPAVANKPNVTGKNVLVHVMPSTPKQLQTTRSVTLTGAMGIAIGMASTAATAFKVWHVHGASTAWQERRVPCVINEAATGGLRQTTGTLNAASILTFGYFSSSTGVAPVWTFSSLWVLDTTIIAGGIAAFPVTIPGIVEAYSNGHERLSALQQGANQMTVYGPLQIGDGGTSPVILNLDSTALEFPSQYNQAAKLTNYCSVDNVAGITYFAGSADVIRHKNSVISSPSKYHWRINSASSTTAIYDFAGLQIIGAGSIQLRAGITLNSVTFNKCDVVAAIGTTLTSCTFSATVGVNALTIASPSEMGLVTKSIFSGNSKAIKITAAGTYSMDGNLFSGNTFDIENASTGLVTINAINGANPTTVTNTGAGATTTIVNAKVFKVANVVSGTEVRIYRTSDSVELGGAETVSATPTELVNVTVASDPDNSGRFVVTYQYGYTADIPIFVVAVSNSYQVLRQTFVLKSTDSSILINQLFDRQYANPT